MKKVLCIILILFASYQTFAQPSRWKSDINFPGSVDANPSDRLTVFTIGNSAFVLGSNNDLWEFHPDPNLPFNYQRYYNPWVRKADFPGFSRLGAVAFSINGKGYLGTGRSISNSDLLTDFYEFNPLNGNSGTWTRKADFIGAGRSNAVGFSANGYGTIGLGENHLGDFLEDFFVYRPQTNEWTTNPYVLNGGGSKIRWHLWSRCMGIG